MNFLSNQETESFKKDGFVKLNSLVSKQEADRAMASLYQLYRKFVPEDDELDSRSTPWNTLEFDNKLIKLRAERPKDFGAMYDAAQNGVEAARVSLNERLVGTVAEVLGSPLATIACSGLLFRIDVPGDKRNTIDWHQDSAYYRYNISGDNAVVATIFLGSTPAESGAVIVCPGSHREGYQEPIDVAGDALTTRQLRLNDTLISKYPQVPATGELGDGYLLQMDVFHRSGFNSSARIRYSIIIRFHRMDQDFIPFKTTQKRNEYIWQELSKSTA